MNGVRDSELKKSEATISCTGTAYMRKGFCYVDLNFGLIKKISGQAPGLPGVTAQLPELVLYQNCWHSLVAPDYTLGNKNREGNEGRDLCS